ncbi:pyridoxal phosphate-dependent aminotransferase [Enterococcus saccharolyticus]|uniref:Aminotransferase n=1 Tax=Candidatus Enterococcus willemsii TaxID=1857215 RepID=A0ABQ6YXC2_9ENTE|nr:MULTISPECIES: pyridoxal phosphate-dependent aminotransferase [Enterococcus]KAF1302464.1 aspartate aminotransferase [Enterococcus sp. CU12B]MCD5000894.1 pyridoxal phosphate-dependent aminotransferase [Enterococcus saccharolyticus]
MNQSRIAKKYQEPKENLLMDIGMLAKSSTDLIDLSLGDPDLITDHAIIEAATEAAKAGHTKYTASDGSQEFLQAVVNHYQRRYGLTFDIGQIRGTVGAMHGTYLALLSILDPGDEVIIHEPYFSPYKEQVEAAGGIPVFIPTYEKDDFQIDLAILEAAITDKTKAILVNSPNNPTGAVFSKETMQGIAEIAIANDLFILSDEIYEELSFSEEFVPMATFAPEHTITFSGFSKAFAMTGWRIGYMISPSYVNDIARQINENITYSAPSLSQQAGIYALQHADELVPKVTNVFKERLNYVKKRVDAIDFLSLGEVKGTMYAFINIEKTNLTSVPFVEHVLKETQVLLIPGKAFGQTTGDSHVRLAVTQDLQTLKEAFDRIEQLSFH